MELQHVTAMSTSGYSVSFAQQIMAARRTHSALRSSECTAHVVVDRDGALGSVDVGSPNSAIWLSMQFGKHLTAALMSGARHPYVVICTQKGVTPTPAQVRTIVAKAKQDHQSTRASTIVTRKLPNPPAPRHPRVAQAKTKAQKPVLAEGAKLVAFGKALLKANGAETDREKAIEIVCAAIERSQQTLNTWLNPYGTRTGKIPSTTIVRLRTAASDPNNPFTLPPALDARLDDLKMARK